MTLTLASLRVFGGQNHHRLCQREKEVMLPRTLLQYVQTASLRRRHHLDFYPDDVQELACDMHAVYSRNSHQQRAHRQLNQ